MVSLTSPTAHPRDPRTDDTDLEEHPMTVASPTRQPVVRRPHRPGRGEIGLALALLTGPWLIVAANTGDSIMKLNGGGDDTTPAGCADAGARPSHPGQMEQPCRPAGGAPAGAGVHRRAARRAGRALPVWVWSGVYWRLPATSATSRWCSRAGRLTRWWRPAARPSRTSGCCRRSWTIHGQSGSRCCSSSATSSAPSLPGSHWSGHGRRRGSRDTRLMGWPVFHLLGFPFAEVVGAVLQAVGLALVARGADRRPVSAGGTSGPEPYELLRR